MFQCRTRLCGWCSSIADEILDEMEVVSMPHAALWVVQHQSAHIVVTVPPGFNAARGFVGGAALLTSASMKSTFSFQCRTRLCGWCSVFEMEMKAVKFVVSMPHAALWVVQPNSSRISRGGLICFNAARGFVGGAAI